MRHRPSEAETKGQFTFAGGKHRSPVSRPLVPNVSAARIRKAGYGSYRDLRSHYADRMKWTVLSSCPLSIGSAQGGVAVDRCRMVLYLAVTGRRSGHPWPVHRSTSCERTLLPLSSAARLFARFEAPTSTQRSREIRHSFVRVPSAQSIGIARAQMSLHRT